MKSDMPRDNPRLATLYHNLKPVGTKAEQHSKKVQDAARAARTGQRTVIDADDDADNKRRLIGDALRKHHKAEMAKGKGKSKNPDFDSMDDYCYPEAVTPTHVVYKSGSNLHARTYSHDKGTGKVTFGPRMNVAHKYVEQSDEQDTDA